MSKKIRYRAKEGQDKWVLNKKIREAQLNQTPLILTIGAKEKESGTLSVRTLDGNVQFGISQNEFLDAVLAHIREKKPDFMIFDKKGS